jgi:FMN hydrolase / 5-amino-6-(5-phospho-D-ribitylamino)uracil phosphatase
MILLFDIMDTVVVDPAGSVVPAFFGLAPEEFMRLRDPEAWRAFEVNRISESECLSRLFADRRAFDHDAFKRQVAAGYRWVPGMEELLAELHAHGVEKHALSNYSSWYELIEQRLGVARFVPWTFVSFHTGLRKPDPAAYTNAARTLARAPGELLFIDDREKNCAAARSVGMHAHRFRGAAALREVLREHGLIPGGSAR